tara:strand:+ start:329 stop:457 length:129 start_codon:yes stop_codon:yes gene_type:complete
MAKDKKKSKKLDELTPEELTEMIENGGFIVSLDGDVTPKTEK